MVIQLHIAISTLCFWYDSVWCCNALQNQNAMKQQLYKVNLVLNFKSA